MYNKRHAVSYRTTLNTILTRLLTDSGLRTHNNVNIKFNIDIKHILGGFSDNIIEDKI